MSAQRLFVQTTDAEGLVARLPEIGLSGVVVSAEVVRVEQHESDPSTLDSIEFELDAYSDRLHISGFRVAAADWVPTTTPIPESEGHE